MKASMQQNIIHIRLDVDDTQYHGAAFNKETVEVGETVFLPLTPS